MNLFYWLLQISFIKLSKWFVKFHLSWDIRLQATQLSCGVSFQPPPPPLHLHKVLGAVGIPGPIALDENTDSMHISYIWVFKTFTSCIQDNTTHKWNQIWYISTYLYFADFFFFFLCHLTFLSLRSQEQYKI